MLAPEIPYNQNAAELVLGTIAQESAYGKYRKQQGNGPALGIGQCEPRTFLDIVINYLAYKPALKAKIMEICHVAMLNPADLVNNDRLAICFARVHYLRCKEGIPGTLDGWAHLWKLRYNTPFGKGTEAEFKVNYKRYVLNEKP